MVTFQKSLKALPFLLVQICSLHSSLGFQLYWEKKKMGSCRKGEQGTAVFMEQAELRYSIILHAREGPGEVSVTQGAWKLKLMDIKLEGKFLFSAEDN